MNDIRRMERMLRKLDHYRTRFNEHNRAITFAQQKRNALEKEIEEFIRIS